MAKMIKKEKPDNLKPFLKWAGGKRQIMYRIDRLLRHGDFKYDIKSYAEPFVGGGAVLFHLLNNYNFDKIYISDINSELINTYLQIKHHPKEFIKRLSCIKENYLNLDNESKKAYFYEIRKKFNNLDLYTNELEKAAYFVFLNKTCFNGLYRVNKDGKFNVPIGHYKNPEIFEENNILKISKALQKVEIINGDFNKSEKFIDKNTLVYFDPPYRPIKKTSFVAYSENNFDDNSQIRLANFAKKISEEKNACFLLSNSEPKNTDKNDSFFENIYNKFNIISVNAKRNINSNSKERGVVKEILIYNFKVEKQMRDFDEWFSKFTTSIATYEYFTDFNKVYKNIENIKIQLNILNSLIGLKNPKEKFLEIIKKYPETIKCLPILLAVRNKEINILDDSEKIDLSFKNIKKIDENILCEFMEKTGLFDLLSNHIINNLVDYTLGIEVGLDSNARKNRGGHLMEDIIETSLKDENINYFKEMYLSDIEKKWQLDLSAISNNGKTEKRFDFVVEHEGIVYAIETNFYKSSGSKLNETARSYKSIAIESKNIKNFVFVWFTDGCGWKSARHNLEETFDTMQHLYNLQDLEDGILTKLFKY